MTTLLLHVVSGGNVRPGVTDQAAEPGLAERGPRHDAQRAVARARHAASTARQAAATQARRSQDERPLFAQPVQDYLYQVLGRPLSVLRAGVATPAGELGLARLRDSGYEITVTTVDQDNWAGPADAGPAGTGRRGTGWHRT